MNLAIFDIDGTLTESDYNFQTDLAWPWPQDRAVGGRMCLVCAAKLLGTGAGKRVPGSRGSKPLSGR
jgi:hypothetical protein